MIRGIVSLLAALAFTGCVHVATEPALEIPQRPIAHFRCRDGVCCLSEADTNAIIKWVKELDAFEAARQRVLKNP